MDKKQLTVTVAAGAVLAAAVFPAGLAFATDNGDAADSTVTATAPATVPATGDSGEHEVGVKTTPVKPPCCHRPHQ